MKDEVRDVAEWLDRETESTKFGEIAVRLVMHAGKIRRVLRTTERAEIVGRKTPAGHAGEMGKKVERLYNTGE